MDIGFQNMQNQNPPLYAVTKITQRIVYCLTSIQRTRNSESRRNANNTESACTIQTNGTDVTIFNSYFHQLHDRARRRERE